MTKIGSKHGVRRDLFKRPLDKTRITDFFGGVAQVEVANADDSIRSNSVLESIAIEEVSPEHHQRVSLPHAPAAMFNFFTWLRKWRVVRAWASVGLLGVLVGWVMSKP